MRLNDFRIKSFLIFVTAVCLSVTGCGNAAADYEGAATEEAEVISDVESDDVSEDIQAPAKNNEDIESQLHFIVACSHGLIKSPKPHFYLPRMNVGLFDI